MMIGEETQLVVNVRSIQLLGPASERLVGKNAYLKLEVGSLTAKTETNKVERFLTSFEETLPFPIDKDDLRDDAILRIKLKTVTATGVTRFKPSKTTICSTNIKASELAEVGSPQNIASFNMVAEDDKNCNLISIELALFWCYKTDAPAPSSPVASRKRVYSRPFSPKTTQGSLPLGLDDAKKCEHWQDNRKGVVDWKGFSRLKVEVIEAKNLIAADSNGFSDPYCIVSCRGTRHKTATVKKNLHPKWAETFSFSVFDNIDEDDEVHFVVRDMDVISRDDDLGQVAIPIWAILRSNQNGVAGWYPLSPTHRMPSYTRNSGAGSIKVAIHFFPGLCNPIPMRTLDASMFSGPPRVNHHRSSSLDELVLSNKPLFYVRVIQARNLGSADANGFSDPYCILKCKLEKQKTRTMKKTLHPKWNQVFQFGSKSYIGDSEMLRIAVYDKDFGVLEGVQDDKLGQVSIPAFLLKTITEPTWFTLESDSFPFAGEIQLSCVHVPPSSHVRDEEARVLYKGKEWLYELHATLVSGTDVLGSNTGSIPPSMYCTLQCGSGKLVKSKTARKTNNPVWNEKFKFKDSVDTSRTGLGRMDNLKITVFDEERRLPLGRVDLSLGDVLDRMGYVDKQGATITCERKLQPLDDEEAISPSDEVEDAEVDPEQIAGSLSRRSTGSRFVQSVLSPSLHKKGFFRRLRKSHSNGSSNASDDERSIEEPASAGAEPSSNSMDSPRVRETLNAFRRTYKEKEDSLKAKLQTFSEQTKQQSASLALTFRREGTPDVEEKDREKDGEQKPHSVDAIELPQAGALGTITLRLHLRPIGELRMVSREKLLVNLLRVTDLSPKGKPHLSIAETINVRASLGLETHESEETPLRPFCSGIATISQLFVFDNLSDALRRKSTEKMSLQIVDSNSGAIVAEGSIEIDDVLKKKDKGPQTMTVPLSCIGSHVTGYAHVNIRTIKVEEEFKPIIGYFHLRLASLKLKGERFDQIYRTAIKYKDRLTSVSTMQGKLSMQFDRENQRYTFAVHDMYSPIEIQIWSQKSVGLADVPDDQESDNSRKTKWGKLAGSCNLTAFDLLELEAQVVHGNRALMKKAVWPLIKLPVTKQDKIKGSVWLEAIFDEDLSQASAPNPNPKLRPPKPFSLANIRTELNRTVAILGGASYIGSQIATLLDWKHKARTCLAVFLTVVFCCFNTFSERFLALPFYVLLFSLMRLHHERTDGRLAIKMHQDIKDRATKASVKVAVLQARGLLPSAFSSHRHARGSSVQLNSDLADSGMDRSPSGKDRVVEKTSRFRSSRLWKLPPVKLSLRALRRSNNNPTTTNKNNNNLQDEADQREDGGDQDVIRDVLSNIENTFTLDDAPSIGGAVKPVTLPSARVKVSLKKKLGDKTPLSLGCTKTSFPSLQPEFSSNIGAYSLSRKKGMTCDLMEWNCGPGCIYPAFHTHIPFYALHDLVLRVRVFRAKNLLNMDASDLSDPFVSVQCRNQNGKVLAGRTRVIKNSLNPEWNEEIVLGTDGTVSLNDTFEVFVWDKDRMSEEQLGCWSIPVEDIEDLFGSRGSPRWILLNAPANPKLSATESEFGSIKIGVMLLDYSRSSAGQDLLNSESLDMRCFHDDERPAPLLIGTQDTVPSLTDAPEKEKEKEKRKGQRTSPESWFRSGTELLFQVENADLSGKKSFMGVAKLPLAALISNEEEVTQKVFEGWIPLVPGFDGSKADSYLLKAWEDHKKKRKDSEEGIGEVLVRVQLTLPDPAAKEKLMELEEAKRADSGGHLAKWRMTKQRLANVQTALYNFNNKMEHFKNLLNWSHPRKTELILRIVAFLAFLLTLVPSRFIILFVSLFMFTERFRPMGTMSLRLNHLLSLLPTDEDLHDAYTGPVVEAKRKSLEDFVHPPNSNNRTRSTSDERDEAATEEEVENFPPIVLVSLDSLDQARQVAQGAKRWYPPRQGKAVRTVSVLAEDLDEGFGSTLRVLIHSSTAFSSSRPKWISLYFFYFPKDGSLAMWTSKEAFESNQPAFAKESSILAIETCLQEESLSGCEQKDCAFALLTSEHSRRSLFRRVISSPRSRSPSSSQSRSPPLSAPSNLDEQLVQDAETSASRLVLVANSARKKQAWLQALAQHPLSLSPPQSPKFF